VVMMMTAYAVEDLVQQALEEGAHEIVYKPLDIEELLRLVEEIPGRKRDVQRET
jgi:DNA-binding response OmpR family regulator